MRQVFHLLDYKSAMIGIRAHLAALLMWYCRRGFPELTVKPDAYWKGGKIDQAAWDAIIKGYVKEKQEVHRFKVT